MFFSLYSMSIVRISAIEFTPEIIRKKVQTAYGKA